MVKWTGSLQVGSLVVVSGATGLAASGERCIENASVTVVGTGEVAPLSMRNRLLGGGPFFFSSSPPAGQQGVSGWNWFLGEPQGMEGLNNLGLLVQTWGRSVKAGSGYFVLDDGSGMELGDPEHPGVRVELPIGVAFPPVGSFVTVTGISSCYRSGEHLYRRVLPRSSEDIAYTVWPGAGSRGSAEDP